MSRRTRQIVTEAPPPPPQSPQALPLQQSLQHPQAIPMLTTTSSIDHQLHSQQPTNTSVPMQIGGKSGKTPPVPLQTSTRRSTAAGKASQEAQLRKQQELLRDQDQAGHSCHQCKNSKQINELIFCMNPEPDSVTLRQCRKKFCLGCLERSYDESIENSFDTNADFDPNMWSCPACRLLCQCASCKRVLKNKANKKSRFEPSNSKKTASTALEASTAKHTTYSNGNTSDNVHNDDASASEKQTWQDTFLKTSKMKQKLYLNDHLLTKFGKEPVYSAHGDDQYDFVDGKELIDASGGDDLGSALLEIGSNYGSVGRRGKGGKSGKTPVFDPMDAHRTTTTTITAMNDGNDNDIKYRTCRHSTASLPSHDYTSTQHDSNNYFENQTTNINNTNNTPVGSTLNINTNLSPFLHSKTVHNINNPITTTLTTKRKAGHLESIEMHQQQLNINSLHPHGPTTATVATSTFLPLHHHLNSQRLQDITSSSFTSFNNQNKQQNPQQQLQLEQHQKQQQQPQHQKQQLQKQQQQQQQFNPLHLLQNAPPIILNPPLSPHHTALSVGTNKRQRFGADPALDFNLINISDNPQQTYQTLQRLNVTQRTNISQFSQLLTLQQSLPKLNQISNVPITTTMILPAASTISPNFIRGHTNTHLHANINDNNTNNTNNQINPLLTSSLSTTNLLQQNSQFNKVQTHHGHKHTHGNGLLYTSSLQPPTAQLSPSNCSSNPSIQFQNNRSNINPLVVPNLQQHFSNNSVNSTHSINSIHSTSKPSQQGNSFHLHTYTQSHNPTMNLQSPSNPFLQTSISPFLHPNPISPTLYGFNVPKSSSSSFKPSVTPIQQHQQSSILTHHRTSSHKDIITNHLYQQNISTDPPLVTIQKPLGQYSPFQSTQLPSITPLTSLTPILHPLPPMVAPTTTVINSLQHENFINKLNDINDIDVSQIAIPQTTSLSLSTSTSSPTIPNHSVSPHPILAIQHSGLLLPQQINQTDKQRVLLQKLQQNTQKLPPRQVPKQKYSSTSSPSINNMTLDFDQPIDHQYTAIKLAQTDDTGVELSWLLPSAVFIERQQHTTSWHIQSGQPLQTYSNTIPAHPEKNHHISSTVLTETNLPLLNINNPVRTNNDTIDMDKILFDDMHHFEHTLDSDSKNKTQPHLQQQIASHPVIVDDSRIDIPYEQIQQRSSHSNSNVDNYNSSNNRSKQPLFIIGGDAVDHPLTPHEFETALHNPQQRCLFGSANTFRGSSQFINIKPGPPGPRDKIAHPSNSHKLTSMPLDSSTQIEQVESKINNSSTPPKGQVIIPPLFSPYAVVPTTATSQSIEIYRKTQQFEEFHQKKIFYGNFDDDDDDDDDDDNIVNQTLNSKSVLSSNDASVNNSAFHNTSDAYLLDKNIDHSHPFLQPTHDIREFSYQQQDNSTGKISFLLHTDEIDDDEHDDFNAPLLSNKRHSKKSLNIQQPGDQLQQQPNDESIQAISVNMHKMSLHTPPFIGIKQHKPQITNSETCKTSTIDSVSVPTTTPPFDPTASTSTNTVSTTINTTYTASTNTTTISGTSSQHVGSSSTTRQNGQLQNQQSLHDELPTVKLVGLEESYWY